MAFFGKIVAVKLGDLGEGTKEATIKQWLVQPGNQVKEVSDINY
jgi:pyruvate/2-oxoglutarate dehydrogenase complex dihydrolipoamide acyltransferase (E2) component